MKTSEYVEQVCGIKLTQYQKDYMDYLDRNHNAEITIPRCRGVITAYDLWILGWVSRVAEVKMFEVCEDGE